LWVTVKGYPEATQRTHPATQARHWFTAALYDLVAWRGEGPKVSITLALPDFPTYRNLTRRIAWLLPEIDVSVLWVGDRGVLETHHRNQEPT